MLIKRIVITAVLFSLCCCAAIGVSWVLVCAFGWEQCATWDGKPLWLVSGLLYIGWIYNLGRIFDLMRWLWECSDKASVGNETRWEA